MSDTDNTVSVNGHGQPPVLRADGVSKTFGDGDDAVTAVDDVSLAVESGSVVGLLGPNGAGKTTLIKSILGVVLPDAGTAEVCGVDVHDDPERAYQHVGAIMEGARNIYWRLTVQENLSFFTGLGGEMPAAARERHERLLDLIGLSEKADTTVNELSRGMKQKVSLVSTLARDVDVVFMDEPTLGLDVEASIDLRSELRRLADEEDVTILLSSHDMDVIETVCDRVVILQDGSITVDEEVDALLDLFRAKQYRVSARPPEGLSLDGELASFDAELTREGAEVHIDLTVTDLDRLYELLSRLREAGATLTDLRSVEVDLEEVFLETLDGVADTTDRQETRQAKPDGGDR